MRSFGALLLFAAFLASPAVFASRAPLRVQAVYRGPDGDLLVEMRSGPGAPEELVSGNTLFWGNRRTLSQLDLTWPDSLGGSSGERVAELGPSEIRVSPEGAETRCESGAKGYARLSAEDARRIEATIRSGRTAIRWLPRIQEPEYLFRVKGGSDYVLITAPRFNFHGDYRVYLGRPGRFREVQVEAPGAGWLSAEPGRIRFRRGGGLYVPEKIDLLQAPRASARRGSPVLMRAGSGALEDLVVPRNLSRAALLKLGFGSHRRFELPTPCGSSTTVASNRTR